MDITDLQDKLQKRVLSLLEKQSQERLELLKDNDLWIADHGLQQGYFFDYRLARLQQSCEQINDIENLEKKNGRLMQKFIEMKIQKRNSKQNNHDR